MSKLLDLKLNDKIYWNKSKHQAWIDLEDATMMSIHSVKIIQEYIAEWHYTATYKGKKLSIISPSKGTHDLWELGFSDADIDVKRFKTFEEASNYAQHMVDIMEVLRVDPKLYLPDVETT